MKTQLKCSHSDETSLIFGIIVDDTFTTDNNLINSSLQQEDRISENRTKSRQVFTKGSYMKLILRYLRLD